MAQHQEKNGNWIGAKSRSKFVVSGGSSLRMKTNLTESSGWR